MTTIENRNQVLLLVILLIALSVMGFLVYAQFTQNKNSDPYKGQYGCSANDPSGDPCTPSNEPQ